MSGNPAPNLRRLSRERDGGSARPVRIVHLGLRGLGAQVDDVAAAEFTALAAGDLDDAVARVLARLGIDDEPLRDAVTTLARGLGR